MLLQNFLTPMWWVQTAKDRRWLKKKNIAHFNRYLQAFEHASFDSFVVVVSEVMACHVNCDFSVCGQGYFHRKITIVFKFSRCFTPSLLYYWLKIMKSFGLP